MSVRVDAMGEMTSLAERKRNAGQRLVIGLEGPAVDDDLRRLVREIRPAGFILFARNVVEPAQVLELNLELASLCDPAAPALLAVDQEGGRVQRIREPATRWPAMRTVGRAEDQTAAVATAMALELRAMGFNLDFAPVADVDSNPANPVIGDRSFGEDPDEVGRHVATFVAAMQAAHVIACAKHFPGHGDTSVDSHLALPIVERTEPELRRVELTPFQAAVKAGVGSLMTSHVVYPAWDEDWPATLSARVIPTLLRRELGFEGVVFSDDLEMKAVHGRWTPPELVQRTTAASVDVLLACKAPELQHELFLELVRAQEESASFERACSTSAKRVHALRERFFVDAPARPRLSVLGSQEHVATSQLVMARGGWSA